MIYLILVGAFVLRLFSLNQSLWLDEATTANTARLSIEQILNIFSPSDFHPPLYYFFMSIWTKFFGYSEIALRAPSVIFSLITIYLVYKIALIVSNKKTALMASLLLSLNPLFVYYSQEARMYMQVTMFFTLAIYFYLSRRKLFFALALPLIFLTDYVAALGIIIFPVYEYLKNKKYSKEFVFSFIPLAVGFLLFSQLVKTQFFSGLAVKTEAIQWWNILGSLSFKNVVLVPVKIAIGRITFDNKILYALVVAVVGSAYGYAIYKSLRSRKQNSLLYLWVALPLVAGFLVSLFIPILLYFRFLFLIPGIALVTGIGLGRVKTNYVFTLLAIVSFSLSSMYLFNPKFHREDWKGFSKVVERESRGKAVVLFVADSQMEAYQYYEKRVPAIAPHQFVSDENTVWLMKYVADIFDPTNTVEETIKAYGYKAVQEYNFNGIVVRKMER